jgi:hypothetical protein
VCVYVCIYLILCLIPVRTLLKSNSPSPPQKKTQIGNNLKYWGKQEEVVAKTLQLFLEMTMGCGAAKVLLTLDTVQYLLQVCDW